MRRTRSLSALLAALQAPFSVDGSELFVRASVGMRVSTTRNDSAEELLRNADIAMYTAKANGKNRIDIFEPSMHDAALDRLALKADLERAVERGEFFVALPAHRRPRDGTSSPAFEALAALAPPQRGVVAPDRVHPGRRRDRA